MDYEFTFSKPSPAPNRGGQTTLTIAINKPTYCRDLKYLSGLARMLRAKMPFRFKTIHGPKVEILGGVRRKNTAQVEIYIATRLKPDVAAEQLVGAGFSEGLEYTL